MFSKHVKARKEYQCTFCRKKIKKGEKHIIVFCYEYGNNDTSYRQHTSCNEKFEMIRNDHDNLDDILDLI